MATQPVLIVGAGPTGLVLALSLARHGVACRIIDDSEGPGEASRAMAVQARTLELYQQLGFGGDMVAAGIPIDQVRIRSGTREIAKLSIGAAGHGLSPYPFVLCFAQDEHERFLVARLAEAGVVVEWGVALKSFAQDADGVRAVLDRGGHEEVATASYICGCDGAHSAVRHGLGLEFAGGSYDQRFYVADVKVAGDPPSELCANIGARDFALMFPVRHSGMQRLIGVVPPGFEDCDPLTFDAIRAPVEQRVGVRVESINWFATYRVHHRVSSGFRRGRAFLAGDAGHIHSPAGGQGMNTGIGDAINLGWKLAHVINGKASAAVLDTYETERIAFARTLVASTDRAFRALVAGGIAGQIVRAWLLPLVVPWLARLVATPRVMFRTVSQLRIAYPDSALSSGRAGTVRGGDRMPWTGSNYATLNGVDWRLQVCGAADPGLAAAAREHGLALDVMPFDAAARAAGLASGAAYLLRPDGYVALALSDQAAAQLTAFVRKFALAP